MKVLLAASEVHPFAKTGGLADVAGALPRALAGAGLDVAVCLPLYPKVRRRDDVRTVVAERVPCTFAGENRPFRLLETEMPGSPGVRVFLVENPWMFEAEEQFYGTEPGSYGDAHLRFLYFSRALLKVPEAAGFRPDVFHLNDWQTALVAPLLRAVHGREAGLRDTATVVTIHNLAYQGVFPVADLSHAGVPGWLLQEGKLLDQGLGNLLAGGIRFADAVSTVSRSYAREILTEEYGCGLEGLLRWRQDLTIGIVNGLDTEVWNPATDPHLPARYDVDDFAGKASCKDALLDTCGLDPSDGPVFGCVSRLADQKGLGLVPPVIDRLLQDDDSIRFVLLGSGQPDLEEAFRSLAQRHPRSVHARLEFDPPFSSLVEAGADLFLMPSRFEPCGLNQLISMRYGTPPIVRRVGGLRDTVTDATEAAIADGTATGFTFDAFDAGALFGACERAVRTFHNVDAFTSIRSAGMSPDWSGARSARQYIDLYDEAVRRRTDGSHLDPVLEDLPPEPLEIELPELTSIPDGYARDTMSLVPFSPQTLFCLWELGGEASTVRLEGFSADDKDRLWYELVVADADSGVEKRYAVGGVSRQYFATVEPGHRYRGELFMHAPGREPIRVLDAPAVMMPPDLRPEL